MMARCEIVLPPKLFLRILMLVFLVLQHVSGEYYEGKRLKPCELEALLRDLTYPDEGYEMHAAALRNQLRQILEHEPPENYQNVVNPNVDGDPYEDKRTYRSLLREGAGFGKRNVGALARAGLLRNQPDYLKRSLATLAKNGQLPSRDTESEDTTPDGEWTEDKRNVVSAFKSGYMVNGKRNIAPMARKYDLPGKRNLQSLLRTGMLPSFAPKRTMQLLARDNALSGYGNTEKRNIQTLVRSWSSPKQNNKLADSTGSTSNNEKRNIQSLKNSQGNGRKKRELYYDDEVEQSSQEILEPVHQTPQVDYEELMDAMIQTYPVYNIGNHLEEKRFLDSLARAGALNRYHRYAKRTYGHRVPDIHSGLRKTHSNEVNAYELGDIDAFITDSREGNYDNDDDNKSDQLVKPSISKRHLASIVRSGWVPSFRPSRGNRFSRAGRARSQIVGS